MAGTSADTPTQSARALAQIGATLKR
jgi:hypothetical protein